MNDRVFESLRTKLTSYNRNTAPKRKGSIRLDSGFLNVKRLLAVLAVLVLVLPSTPLLAVVYPDVITDYIDVQFELVEETPVSVTFEVIVTNSSNYDLSKLPVEILVDGAPVETITLTKHEKYSYKTKEPVYSEVQKSYTSKYGIYDVTDASKDEAGNTFTDYDKDGKVVYEGYYETFDKTKLTWYWTESEITGEKTVDKVDDVKTDYKVREKGEKVKTTFLELPTKDDGKTGYGAGTAYYTITLDTGLLTTSEGWGSAGVMTWRIAGKDYKDLENSSWWASSWRYKMRLTFDGMAAVAEDLTDFPVSVFLDNTNFDFSHVQPDGDDIRFVDADNNNLAYEIDLSSDWTDEALMYVCVPFIEASSADNYIDMYFGNPTCGSGENIHDTWNDDYVFVSHMNDDALGTGILDSTSNANHGTKGAGATAPTEVDGLVGKAQSFDDTHWSLKTPVLNLSTYTIESLHYLTASHVGFGAIGGYTSSRRILTVWSGDYGILHQIPTGWYSTTSFTPSAWESYAFTDNGASQACYLNGDSAGTGAYTTTIANNWYILSYGNNTYYNSTGLSCEYRISSTARGEGWIKATNLTLRDLLIDYGSETWADIPQGPTDLTYTIDGDDVILNWVKGLRADITVIVRKTGSYPMTPADGEVVYDGAGITATDADIVTETNELYYRAWSYNDWGYSIEYAEARKGALMTELFMVLGLTAFAFWRKEIWVYLPAIMALVFFGMRWAESDLIFGMPFFALALFMTVRLGWVTFQKVRN